LSSRQFLTVRIELITNRSIILMDFAQAKIFIKNKMKNRVFFFLLLLFVFFHTFLQYLN
jgi:hypothetical protein